MIEIVNPKHPDKICDRIAGAIVDMAYAEEENPKVAVEVLLGHGVCHIITEASVIFEVSKVEEAVKRITEDSKIVVDLQQVPQDVHLANNQAESIHCGDNGIFKGMPLTLEEVDLFDIANGIYEKFPYDGKYILDGDKLVVCQSNAEEPDLTFEVETYGVKENIINPLGYWTGGPDVDTGATNRKLGSDQGHSVSGGGVNGKDLSKADVSVNIYAWLKAQKTGEPVMLSCAIGDDTIDGRPYSEIVEIARKYIYALGGFEKFSEWGFRKVTNIDFESFGM